MSPHLDEKLVSNFPKIFKDRYSPMDTTLMCWGFECGDGWYDLLDRLCFIIQDHLDWVNRTEEKVPQVVAVQVKEKFGGLRFYYDGGDEHIGGMVRMAESMSYVTCETCGERGKVRGGGWFYTACELHTRPEDKIES